MGVFMTIGIPKGLLYSKYHVFGETFLSRLGASVIASPETNKEILDAGVRLCVDDSCMPVKVFHGHVAWLRDKCDMILIPRFMTIEKKEYVCPMFCGLIEMVKDSIQGLPRLICEPIYSLNKASLWEWAVHTARPITRNRSVIYEAFMAAIAEQCMYKTGFNDTGFPMKAALAGHVYNINDPFVNMNLVKKLNRLGIGVITPEYVCKAGIEKEVGKLFKKPFWHFAQQYYGSAVHLFNSNSIDGIVYVSAFSCGVDSVVIELIRNAVGAFPFMVLKIDEHTGEAALDTRIEAFADMLKRRTLFGNNNPEDGQYLPCSQGVV
jgi:predicted nucleotide-binding protein (sugar kinase/HSP70/actin superfamily)